MRSPTRAERSASRCTWSRRNNAPRQQRNLAQDLGREPTEDEISEVIGLPRRRVARDPSWPTNRSRCNLPVGEEDSELGDLIEDSDAGAGRGRGLLSCCTSNSSRSRQLGERERHGPAALRPGRRRAAHAGRGRAAAFGVTGERVRQIEAKSLAKLRTLGCPGRLWSAAADRPSPVPPLSRLGGPASRRSASLVVVALDVLSAARRGARAPSLSRHATASSTSPQLYGSHRRERRNAFAQWWKICSTSTTIARTGRWPFTTRHRRTARRSRAGPDR